MDLPHWIGRLVSIRFKERTKPMAVRIDAIETPIPCCARCPSVYFIGRYG